MTAVINFLSCLLIVIVGLFLVINQMTHETRHDVRFAWIVITTDALGELIGPFYGAPSPSSWSAALHLCFAIYLVVQRPA